MVKEFDFKNALGRFATGVTVVTAGDGKDGIAGLTANAFTSVSLDPPLVLVCVGYHSSSYPVLAVGSSFAVNILASDQEEVALAFAQKDTGKFQQLDWQRNGRGTPVLPRCLAVLDCQCVEEFSGGDHAILIGRVREIDMDDDDRAPLTYYRGRFNHLVSATAAAD